MYLSSLLVAFFIVSILILYRFVKSPDYDSIILMTGMPGHAREFFNNINGTWLLMPEDYDQNNINKYRRKKTIWKYYCIGIFSLSMLSTIVGLSKVTYSREYPVHTEITIKNFDKIKKYLNLSPNYRVVEKKTAIFRLSNLELNYYRIRDGKTTHLVETYRHQCYLKGPI